MTNIDIFNKDKDCFIGLRYSANHKTPSSGLYINDLAGMNLKRFSSLASNETHRGEDLFKILHDEAILDVLSDFTGALSESFNFNYTIGKRKIGQIGSVFGEVNKDIKRGCLFEKITQDQTQKLKVRNIEFNSDIAVDDCSFFVETLAGTDEIKANVKAGLNRILIDVESNEDYVYVYTTNCFNLANETLKGCSCSDICSSCSHACGDYYAKPYLEEVEGTKVFVSNNFIQYNVSTLCDDFDLISEFSQELKFAVRMKIASKVMEEVMVSDGVHPLVRNGKEDAQTLLTKFNGGVNVITGFEEKSEYGRLLDAVVRKAKTYLENFGGQCTSCNHDVKYFESIP
jgi:hypothetical protein